jgi:hypothetical protein
VRALRGVCLHRYPRSSPHATDGSRSVGVEGGAGAADNAEYEWVGGRDTSQDFAAQIIHYDTVATARQIMRFDATAAAMARYELKDNRAFGALFPCSSKGVCGCGTLHEITSKVVKVYGID